MFVLFSAWGYDVTGLEFASVILAVLGIGLGIRGTRWAWPFYFLASLLYAWLFLEFDLLASAALQVVFMVAAVWGWFGWGAEGVREPNQLAARTRLLVAVGMIVAWLLTAPLLQAIGGAATWPDAFILIGSLVAQVLMVREYVEAWPLWMVVNFVGVVHYANQGLWFTSLFYGLLIVMAAIGWREWSARRANALAAGAGRVSVS